MIADRAGRISMYLKKMKPKARHEHMLASADTEKIVEHLENGENDGVTRIAVTLARKCKLFVHFSRLWKMRVKELKPQLSSERWMKNVYMNKNALYKELRVA